jgi:hypothetical protein
MVKLKNGCIECGITALNMNQILNRKILHAVLAAFSLVLITSGCILLPVSVGGYWPRTINVTSKIAWWGELGTNRIVRLKVDSMIYNGGLENRVVQKDLGNYRVENIKIEEYKANPSRWPEIGLVKQGTILRCTRLERYFFSESAFMRLDAEIIDGDFKGRVVPIGSFTQGGDVYHNSTPLRLNPKYLEVVK